MDFINDFMKEQRPVGRVVIYVFVYFCHFEENENKDGYLQAPVNTNSLFVFGVTACSGPGPPHSRGF